MNRRELMKLAEKLGWVFLRQTNHIIYKKGIDIVAIPNHNKIKKPTYKQIVKTLNKGV